MVRKYIIVTGRVQGVGFRYHAMNLAMEYDLTGWVRNLYNGGVEMESVADQPQLKEESGFQIRY